MQLSVHGIDTHYERMGRGPTLVLLHGWGCDWQIWSPIIPELTKHFDLVIPDLPAFGRSSNPPLNWNSSHYVEWLSEFLKQVLADQSFFVIGHSFGGKVAAFYASQKPPLLRKLILVDSAGVPDQLSSKQTLQQTVLRFIPSVIKNRIPHTLKQTLLQSVGAATDHLNSTPQQRKILENSIRENVLTAAEKISVPTLLIWGEWDTDTPLRQGQELQQHIPHAKLITFPNAGHFTFSDEPTEFIKNVTAFLQ